MTRLTYRVEHDASPRESFGEYRYRIYRGDRLVANYWHDFRGDEHGIGFISGKSESWPVGRMVDFLEGGGPGKPTVLSKLAIAYMEERLT
jgi:hypothetical protein